MGLMDASGVFFAERDDLVIEADVLWLALDDHDVVHLSRICFP